MKRIRFLSARVLPRMREKMHWAFQTLLADSGVHDSGDVTRLGGELFIGLRGTHAFGAAWIRPWPGKPDTGDIHVVMSAARARDFDTLVAFDQLLLEREQIMAFKRWRVYVNTENFVVISALKTIRFQEKGETTFPGIGSMVILEREVI